MPFSETALPDVSPTVNASIQDTELSNSHSVLFLTTQEVFEFVDTSVSDSVSLEIITLDTSLGFPGLDVQLDPVYAQYVY